MKLNYKRTLLVGFAFLSICAFWQSVRQRNPPDLKKHVPYEGQSGGRSDGHG